MLPILDGWDIPPGCEDDFNYQPAYVHGRSDIVIIGRFPIGVLQQLDSGTGRNDAKITGTTDSGTFLISLWMRTFKDVYREACKAADDGYRIKQIELRYYEPPGGGKVYYF